jgi:hypothetical protein
MAVAILCCATALICTIIVCTTLNIIWGDDNDET